LTLGCDFSLEINLMYEKNSSMYKFLKTLLKRWYIALSIILVFFFASWLYATSYIVPVYSSSARLYIIDQNTPALSTAEIAVSTYLAKDFEVIITDNVILDKVAAELGFKYSTGQIKRFISVTNIQNTRIIELNVVSPSAEDSKHIVDAICDIVKDEITEIIGVDRISIISKSRPTNKPIFTQRIKTVFYSVILGFVLSLMIIAILVVTNNKISNAQDVEDILNLNVLATIPYNQNKRAKS
jgi:capsular polysaccharide biosynthesis protein